MNSTSRIKKSRQLLRLVRPFELSTSDLIYPIFIREDGKGYEISSMKGQKYLSLDDAIGTCQEVVNLGIPAIMVFGVVTERDSNASVALRTDSFHAKIFKKLKTTFGDDLALISNVCLCDYTKDEFCVFSEKGRVLNQKTAEMLAKIAVVHAEAGADMIAPAAMADGQVKSIRTALDKQGLDHVAIMSYVKTDSNLFQPFFAAMTHSATPRATIDSSRFRVDVINQEMFMQKVDLDINEGADIVIVKPALTNLDLILRVKQKYPTVPVAAYQVSGEYAMIKSAAEKGLLDEKTMIIETLSSIKRAGASMILSYSAIQAARMLNESRGNINSSK